MEDISKEPKDVTGDSEPALQEDQDEVACESGIETAAGQSDSSSDDELETDAADKSSDRGRIAPGNLRFIAVFVTTVIAVFVVYSHFKNSAGMAKYMSLLATQVAFMLRSIQSRSVVLIAEEAIIKYRGFPMQVIPDCGAIPSMSIFTAAVLAFPAHVWKKAIAILLGLPLLYAVNVGRLTCLALIGAHFPAPVFHFVHLYVWQTVFIVFVVMVWFAWIGFVKSEKGWRHYVLNFWRTSLLGFALRFVCFGMLFLALFTVALPLYTWLMVHVSGFCLQVLAGYDIRGVAVSGSYGISDFAFSSEFLEKVRSIKMSFQIGQGAKSMVASELAFTSTPFLALVAAAGGVKWRRRLAVAGIGLGILLAWQLMIVLVFFVAQIGRGVEQGNHVLRVIAFMNAVLPFLMWFVMLALPQISNWPKRISRKDNESDNEIEQTCSDSVDGAAGGCDKNG